MMQWYGIDLGWAYNSLLPNIYRQTYCRHHALDILHDALVRFAMTDNNGRYEQPHAYLRTIVRNLLLDSVKESARVISLEFDDEKLENGRPGNLPSVEHITPSAEHIADIQQRLHILQSVIDRLPARCRKAFWLYRIEGLPQQEIADQLGISLNMVQRHIMRAMQDMLEARDLLR
jgi:RNA polymerase sigma factor (sigma-70 family)